MAFRMLVKDLLVLVQAVNEGVVNLLGKPSSSLPSRNDLTNPARAQNTTLRWRKRTPRRRSGYTRRFVNRMIVSSST